MVILRYDFLLNLDGSICFYDGVKFFADLFNFFLFSCYLARFTPYLPNFKLDTFTLLIKNTPTQKLFSSNHIHNGED